VTVGTTGDGSARAQQAERDIAGTLDGQVGRPVARNVAALWGAQGATLVLHLAWFAVLTAHLGSSRLGIYVFAVAIPDLLGPFVDFGFTTITARDVAQRPELEQGLVPNLFYLRLALSVVAYAVTLVVLDLAGYHPATLRAAAAAVLILVVASLQAFQVSLEVRLRMTWVGAGSLAEAVLLAGGVVVLAHRGSGIQSFVWLYVGANLVNYGVVAGRALSLVKGYRWAPAADLLRPMVRAALPLGAAGVVTGLYYRLNVLILARAHSSAAVGQFGAGYRFLDTVGAFPGLLVAVLIPVFSRAAASGADRGTRPSCTWPRWPA
jgi:O-antigen/teichoic acid export membrane protein